MQIELYKFMKIVLANFTLQLKIPKWNYSLSSVPIRALEVKLQWLGQYLGKSCLLFDLQTNRGCEGLQPSLICATVKGSTSKYQSRGSYFFPWKFKIVRTCLWTTFKVKYQTVNNSPLHSSNPTFSPFNHLTLYSKIILFWITL